MTADDHGRGGLSAPPADAATMSDGQGAKTVDDDDPRRVSDRPDGSAGSVVTGATGAHDAAVDPRGSSLLLPRLAVLVRSGGERVDAMTDALLDNPDVFAVGFGAAWRANGQRSWSGPIGGGPLVSVISRMASVTSSGYHGSPPSRQRTGSWSWQRGSSSRVRSRRPQTPASSLMTRAGSRTARYARADFGAFLNPALPPVLIST